MSSKRERRRSKRRADKNIEAAWKAVDERNLDLAERLVLRALDSGPANARYWRDRSEIALLRGDAERAVSAAAQAVSLSPSFAEGHLALAEGLLLAGQTREARKSFEQVQRLSPKHYRATEALASLPTASVEAKPPQAEEAPSFTTLTERFDWVSIHDELTARGLCRIPGLLSVEKSEQIAGWISEDERFEHDVCFDDERGRVRYRFFREPLPSAIVEVRSELYARLSVIANAWAELLGRKKRWPATHERMLAECRAEGQARQSVILLDYPRGGRNSFHRDVVGRVCFPLQCAISLGPAGPEEGGELVLVDDRPGRKIRERRVSTGPGDAVVFCSQARLVKIAGLYGLQAVRHGVAEVTAERRLALGVPFQPYVGGGV